MIFLGSIHEIKVATAVEELSLAALIPCYFVSQRPEMSFLLGQAQMDTLRSIDCLTKGIHEGR